jgi:hypothetical protein
MTLAKNVGRLATIASLVPDQEIRTENFERRYPSKSFSLMVINCLTPCEAPAHDQADIDEFIADVSRSLGYIGFAYVHFILRSCSRGICHR